MRTRRRSTIQDLRLAIDGLPRHTRVAMLEGIRHNDIIVGAYSSDRGICPMLAAHRTGGRTSFPSFARAWDRFAFRGAKIQLARRATERELLILRTHLEASLLDEDGPAPDLAAAMAEHQALVQRRGKRGPERSEEGRRRERAASDPRPGDADRARELRKAPGWAWLQVFRRYDDYERALQRLESEQDALREREPIRS
jgi:hypothetical protein